MTLSVGASVLGRFANLAAFLLPLKVLLLAGSDGVPRYFKAITDADNKLVWIVVLSVTAAAFYFLARFLKAFSENLSEVGSQKVVEQASQLSLFGSQDTVARRHFRDVTGLCANLFFVFLSFMVLAFINPLLTLALALLFSLQYGVTVTMLGRDSSQTALRIYDKPGVYLQQLHTINFWSSFLILLVPFLIGAGGNIILAILAFLLVRQALTALMKAIETTVSLARERHLITALALPSHRWQRNSSSIENFYNLFEKEEHLQKIGSVLGGHFNEPRPATLRWKDSPLGGVGTFVLTFRAGPGGPFYQEQVFSPYQSHLINNEEVLFQHIGREVLGAPVIYQRFTHGLYHCRLCDYGTGEMPSPSVWNSRYAELLERLWSIEPPDSLVRAFVTSHLLLHERLTSEFYRGLELAVTDDKESSTLQAFAVALPAICDVLSAMPLYVSNRDMFRSNTVLRGDGGVSVMMWGRWRLEPIGVRLPSRTNEDKLSAMLARVRERRPQISETLSPDHLRLAAACRKLEMLVAEANYEAALGALPAIVGNPILQSGEIKDLAPARSAEDHDVHMTP